MHRIQESSYAKKETVDIDILVTSRNGNKKIMWFIWITDLSQNNEVELVEPVQMNIYQSKTYLKELSWLYFDNEPRVQESRHVKDQQSCISAFVAYLTASSSHYGHLSRHDNSIPCMPVYGRFIEIQSKEKEIHRTNQGSNFLEGSFGSRDSVGAPI